MCKRERDNVHTCRMWLWPCSVSASLFACRGFVLLLTTLHCFFCSWINIFHKFQGRSLLVLTLSFTLLFRYYGNLKAKTNETEVRDGDPEMLVWWDLVCTSWWIQCLQVRQDSVQSLQPMICLAAFVSSSSLSIFPKLTAVLVAVFCNAAEGGRAERARVRNPHSAVSWGARKAGAFIGPNGALGPRKLDS